MAQKREIAQDINLGTDNWNVADGYAKLKILRQLVLLDRYDTIAQFGTDDISEENLDINDINKKRIEGIQRFYSTLYQLIGNVFFAIKKEDKKILEGLKTRMQTCNEFLPKCYKMETDHVDKNEDLIINEEMFSKLLKIMQDVKNQLNTPLNNANLIFRASEEIDLDRIMQGIVEGG